MCLRQAILLSLLFSLRTVICANQTKDVLLTGFFWEVKPFIFTNEDREIDGIIPHMFRRANSMCLAEAGGNYKRIIDFSKRYPSRKEFYRQMHEGVPYEQGEFENVSKGEVYFGPVLNELNPEWETDHGYRSFTIMKTTEIAVIVPREMIDLPNKILRGIASCNLIFFIALPMAVFFSILVWFIERLYNKDIERSFIRGIGTAFWWSIVSMTTVGYGDIVPKAPLGRFVSVFWLLVGILLGCVMTATMTDVVSGIGHLSVYGQQVAVLNGSYEEKVASRDYQAKTVSVETYEKVLELVRDRKVFAAMMNADVAAWYQDTIKSDDGTHPPLHIIEKKPANLYVRVLMNNVPNDDLKKVIRCMYLLREEIYTYSQEKFQRYCHTETLHIGTVSELFQTNLFLKVLVPIVCFLIFVGLVYDFVTFTRSSRNYTIDFSQVLDGLFGKPRSVADNTRNGLNSVHVDDEAQMLTNKSQL